MWDFERVAHANTLPEHWAYIHMGVDDFETRKANREGFQRLMLRPGDSVRMRPSWTRRSRCSAADGTRRCSCARSRRSRRITRRARAGPPERRARAKILQIQSNSSSQSYEAIAEARGEPHWFQIYTVADWNMNKKLIDHVAAAGCPALVWTIDLLGGSNRELSRRSLGPRGIQPAALPELPQPQAGLPAADAPRARRSARTASAVHVGLRQAAQGRHRA